MYTSWYKKSQMRGFAVKDLLAQVTLELFHLPLQLLLPGLPLTVEVSFALLHPGI